MDKNTKTEQRESLADETRAILEEARMVLPGIQALFGFQLIAVFNARFIELDAALQATHLVALIGVAIAMALVMTPAAYHRIAERGRISTRFADLASLLIAVAMAPLAVSVALDACIVTAMVSDSLLIGEIVGALMAVLFFEMWFAWPLLESRRARH